MSNDQLNELIKRLNMERSRNPKLDFVQKYNGWVVRKAVQRQTRRRESSEWIASAIEIPLPRRDGTGNRY